MFYGYAEQVERLKTKLAEKDTSQVHFLDMQDNGTFIDTHTKITYKNWDEIKKREDICDCGCIRRCESRSSLRGKTDMGRRRRTPAGGNHAIPVKRCQHEL